MPISIQCGSCQQSYNVNDQLAGKKVKCKQCGAPIAVPSGQPEGVLELEAPDPYSQPIAPAPPPSSQMSQSGRRVSITRCPSCTAVLSEGATVCTLCGMNLQTGRKENVDNFLNVPLSGDGSDDRPKKQWFRKRGNPMLQSLDEMLKLVLIIIVVAGIVIWVWHLYKSPAGITLVSLLPLGVVTLLLAGVIAPAASFAVKAAVGLLKFIPRLDTYVRIVLALMLPFAGSLIAGFPGQEQNLAFLPPLCWFLSIALLIYFLRAEMIEWLVSATVAFAAIMLTWLLTAGILTSAGKSAPLYGAMLPSGIWASFMPLQEVPPPEKPKPLAENVNTNATNPANNTGQAPGGTTPQVVTGNNVAPTPDPNNTGTHMETPATGVLSQNTGVTTTPPGTGTTNVTPAAPVVSLASPLLSNIDTNNPGLKGVHEVIASRVNSNYFLVTKVSPDHLTAERWTVSPLEKKNEATIDYVPGKKAPQLALSANGTNLVVLHFFPTNKLELINMEGKPRKNVSLVNVPSTPTLLGFIDQVRFALRLDIGAETGLQMRSAIDGGVMKNVQPQEGVMPGMENIALSTTIRFATVGRDRRISVYTYDNPSLVAVPTAQFSPTSLPYRSITLSCAPDGNQLALFAIVQDTPTILSFKAQHGEAIASKVITTAHPLAAVVADPESGLASANDLIWLQNGTVWLAAGTKFVETTSGRDVGSIEATGIADRIYLGNNQFIFLAISKSGDSFDGIAAKLDEAKLKAALKQP